MAYIGSPAAPAIATVSDGTVTSAKLADDAVTSAKLINNAVTSAKITDGAVTPTDLSTGHPNWDSSGNVGIGTSSPSNKLQIYDSTATSTTFKANTLLNISSNGSGADATINLTDGVANNAVISQLSGQLLFGAGAGATERMRIDSSGNLLVGVTTGQSAKLVCSAGGNTPAKYSSASAAVLSSVNSTNADVVEIVQGRYDKTCLTLSHTNIGSQSMVIFRVGVNTPGSIYSTASSTSYNTSSDYRLKEDWQPMSGSIDRVKALKPVNFAWKADGSRVDGFLAHEAQEVVPEAITGTKDAMRTEEYEVTPAVLDDDGNVVTEAVMGTREVPDYQGIDQSKLVPLLTAALQEAITKIETLEARVATLESA